MKNSAIKMNKVKSFVNISNKIINSIGYSIFVIFLVIFEISLLKQTSLDKTVDLYALLPSYASIVMLAMVILLFFSCAIRELFKSLALIFKNDYISRLNYMFIMISKFLNKFTIITFIIGVIIIFIYSLIFNKIN